VLQDKTDGLLDIYEESAGGNAILLVIGHSTEPEVLIVLKYRTVGNMPGLQRGSNKSESIQSKARTMPQVVEG
jgi:hypothetical protein